MIRARFTLAALSFIITACSAAHPDQASSPAAHTAAEDSGAIQTFTSDAAGFDTHSFWVDTGREVVVFDAQFTDALARKLIAEIQAKTTSPIRFVVVTHPNPDKFNGAAAFQSVGAKVVASRATAAAIPGVHAYKKYYFVQLAKMFTDATYPAEAKVDITFTGDLELPLEGGTKIRLHELTHPAVSSTQTVAFLPSAHALIVGDMVHTKAHAWLEGGIVDGKPAPDLASWKDALEELRVFRGATVYGGRGETASVDAAVDGEKAYLDRMNALVSRYVAELGPAKKELAGPGAAEHHKRIAALASREFPDYAYPYLVEYGVYGLAGALARRLGGARTRSSDLGHPNSDVRIPSPNSESEFRVRGPSPNSPSYPGISANPTTPPAGSLTQISSAP